MIEVYVPELQLPLKQWERKLQKKLLHEEHLRKVQDQKDRDLCDSIHGFKPWTNSEYRISAKGIEKLGWWLVDNREYVIKHFTTSDLITLQNNVKLRMKQIGRKKAHKELREQMMSVRKLCDRLIWLRKEMLEKAAA